MADYENDRWNPLTVVMLHVNITICEYGRESSFFAKERKAMNKRKYDGCANLLKVMAHPIRLAILDSLKHGTKCVNDVVELLSTPQPNISQHLSVLRREGIVTYTEDGSKRCYSIVDLDYIKALMDVIEIRWLDSGNCPVDESVSASA